MGAVQPHERLWGIRRQSRGIAILRADQTLHQRRLPGELDRAGVYSSRSVVGHSGTRRPMGQEMERAVETDHGYQKETITETESAVIDRGLKCGV